jgi:hypothetical protein
MRACNPLIAVAVVVLCPAWMFAGTVSGKVVYAGTRKAAQTAVVTGANNPAGR